MNNQVNTLEKKSLVNEIIEISNRISILESLLQGKQIDQARILDLKVDKLTTGTLIAIASMGGLGSSARIKVDGENSRIVINDGSNDRIVIGKRSSGVWGMFVSKSGVDVFSATTKQLIFSSDFDTFKIKITGTISVSLPSATFGGSPSFEQLRTYSANITHSLGYIPYFLPRPNDVVVYTDAAVVSSGSYVVNDIEENDLPTLGYGTSVLEYARLIATTNQLILRILRQNTSFTNVTFGARTASVYYTLFYNKVNQEVSYL